MRSFSLCNLCRKEIKFTLHVNISCVTPPNATNFSVFQVARNVDLVSTFATNFCKLKGKITCNIDDATWVAKPVNHRVNMTSSNEYLMKTFFFLSS